MLYTGSAFSPFSSPDISSEHTNENQYGRLSPTEETPESVLVETRAPSSQLNPSKRCSRHQYHLDRNDSITSIDPNRPSISPRSENGTIDTLCEPITPWIHTSGDLSFAPLSSTQTYHSWPSRVSSLYHGSLDSADLSHTKPHARRESNRTSSSTTASISGPLSTRSSVDPALNRSSQNTCWDSISSADYYPSRETPHPPEKEPQSVFDVDSDDEDCDKTVFARLTTSLHLPNNSEKATSQGRRWRCLSNPCKQIRQYIPRTSTRQGSSS